MEIEHLLQVMVLCCRAMTEASTPEERHLWNDLRQSIINRVAYMQTADYAIEKLREQ